MNESQLRDYYICFMEVDSFSFHLFFVIGMNQGTYYSQSCFKLRCSYFIVDICVLFIVIQVLFLIEPLEIFLIFQIFQAFKIF